MSDICSVKVFDSVSRKHAICPKHDLWTLQKNDSSTPKNSFEKYQ